jgi:flagellar basal-body rod protein FlgF
MDNFVYVAASGARETMLAQANNANNLANASTTGFRNDLLMARSALVVDPSRNMTTRIFGMMETSGIDFSEGTINTTGRELDVAVNGQGWIAVLASDGSEAYSRRGDLRVDQFGQLVDGAGSQIMGKSGPIALPPFSQLEVGADGTISIVAVGETPNTLSEIDRIKLVNPGREMLVKNEDGTIRTREGEEIDADPAVSLLSGSLESSNVNTVESMVRMIELSRQFESHIKMMKTAEELNQSSVQLMSMS